MKCFCCNQEHERKPSPAFRWMGPIPALLHHVWLSHDLPSPFLKACRDSFIDKHPRWSRILHREPHSIFSHPALADDRELLNDAWERFGKLGKESTPWGPRSDLLRLAAIFIHGGFYVDHDLFCLRRLDAFRLDDLVLCNWQDEPLAVTEIVIGARAGDPRILNILQEFCRCEVKGNMVNPRLTCFVHCYGWKTYPSRYFCPHPRSSDDLYRTTPDTHAVHCWKEHEYDLDCLRQLQC